MVATTDRNLKALRRFVEESAAFMRRETPPEHQPEEESRIVDVFRSLVASDVDFSRVTSFDELFLMPLRSQVVDVTGVLWIKLVGAQDPYSRGWSPIPKGFPPSPSIPGCSEDSCSRGVGPLKHGAALRILGDISAAWWEEP